MGPTPSSRGFEAPFEVFRRLNSSCFIDPFRPRFIPCWICSYSYPGKRLEDVIWVT